MALTTLNSVKAQGGIASSDTSRDSQLRSLIDGITSLVKQQLNRDIESRSYVEFYSGDDSPFLLLNQYPVTAVELVCVDDAGYFGAGPAGFDSSRNLTPGVDYALMAGTKGIGSTGMLRRIGATWHRLPTRACGIIQNLPGIPSGNVKILYTAGFSVIPAAISMAVNAAVLRQAMTAITGGAASQMGYEDASVSFLAPEAATGVLGCIESTLANYRSIPI